MTVKLLFKEDLSQIIALYNKDFADGWNAKMLQDAFDGGRFICAGVFDCDKLVGVITCSKAVDDADIEGVVTDKDYRRRKIATTLLDFVTKTLKNDGIKKLFLEVRESNDSAIAFYQSQGFEKISVRKKYYQDGENALVFVKEI